MKDYIVIYTLDKGAHNESILIRGQTYTQAYVNASLRLPNVAEILSICEVVDE